MPNDEQLPLIEKLRFSLSSDRIGTYLTAAGFDHERALRLYLWNAFVGEAFHLPVQAVEVCLRNSINFGLSGLFGPEWWRDSEFLRLAEHERKSDLELAQRRIRNRGRPLVTGQMVATLSFGFWVGVLQPRYNPAVWSAQLRIAFPDLPANKSRYDLADGAKKTADLRNRIWHHEPVFRMNLSEEFHSIMEFLAWLSPEKAGWVRPHCRIPALLRQKP
jgi:hypothetical protein